MSDQEHIIQKFKEFTQANDSIARSYLEMSNYNLEQAVENYFKFVKPKGKGSTSSTKPTGMYSFRDIQGEDKENEDAEQRYYAGRYRDHCSKNSFLNLLVVNNC